MSDALLDAARDVFEEYGARRANVDDIARAAGISRSTLYRRFANQEALLEVMYDIPERTDVKKVVITGETIDHGKPPMLVTESEDAEPRRRRTRAARPEEREEESA